MAQTTLDNRLETAKEARVSFLRDMTVERFNTFAITAAILIAFIGYIALNGWGFNIVTLLGDFYANVSSELLSIVITVGIIDQLNRRRDKRQQQENQKAVDEYLKSHELAELIALVVKGSKVATDVLRNKGWLFDGSLEGVDLEGKALHGANLRDANLIGANLRYARLNAAFLWKANLQNANLRKAHLERARLIETNLWGANLSGANLQEANLHGANLQDAVLQDANLQSATLNGAKLEGADLSGVNLTKAKFVRTNLKGLNLSDFELEGVNLRDANLQDARLRGANLRGSEINGTNLQGANLNDAKLEGANLRGANLQMANMQNTHFDEETILPDKTNWTNDTDMRRFTDSAHPQFDETLAKINEYRASAGIYLIEKIPS